MATATTTTTTPQVVPGGLLPSQMSERGPTMSGLRKSLDSMRITGDPAAIRVIPTITASVDDEGVAHGVVYVVQDSMEARKIMTSQDLCAGVSGYVLDINDDARGREAIQRLRKMGIELQGLDYSILTWDQIRQKYMRGPDEPPFHEMHLGRENCSIGLSQFHTPEGEVRWLLIIRSYDVMASRRLYDYIHMQAGYHYPTVKEVFTSGPYVEAVKMSAWNRDAMAYYLMTTMGLPPSETYTRVVQEKSYILARSSISNPYDHLVAAGNVYRYYDHCYSTHEAKQGILFGRGRAQGWLWIRGNSPEADKSWFCKDFDGAFPMGVPRKIDRADLRPGFSCKSKCDPTLVSYGTQMECNYKAIPDLYHHDLHNTREWAELRKKLGFEIVVQDVPYRNRFCYTSSPQPRTVPIGENLFLAEQAEKDHIVVPIDDTFCTEKLMAGHAKLHAENPRVTLRSIIKGQNGSFYKMDRALVQKILGE